MQITDPYITLLQQELEQLKLQNSDLTSLLSDKSVLLNETNEKLKASTTLMEGLLSDQSIQLNTIVENSSLGIVLTEEGVFIKANKAFQQMLGYSQKELSEMTVKDVSHKGDFPASKSYLTKLNDGLINHFLIKKRYLKKNGRYITCNTNVSAVRDTEGKVKYQVAIIEDVTRKEEQSKMLNAINKLSISILGKRNLSAIAWEIVRITADHLGLEDCVVYAVDNDKQQLTQVAAYVNKCPMEHLIQNILTIPMGYGIVGSVAKTGIPELINDTSVDNRYIIDDKARLSELSVPIIVNNKVIGVIDSEHSQKDYFTQEHFKTFTNIANLAAAQFNNALSLIKEETARKENNKLLVKLKKSNEELENFAQVVSHDLKSPLRSMSAIISWIQEDNQDLLNPETTLNFERLHSKLDKMDHLINGILKYSSIDKINQTIQAVNIHQLVLDILQVIHVPAHIHVQIQGTLPSIDSNKFRMQQLFQNIISNAIKYIDKPKGVVQISAITKGNNVIYKIEDNGIGIEKKYHNKIFEIFETLETSEGHATGIGLSIVKKIINSFKGEIWLESGVGKGTTFYIKLQKKILDSEKDFIFD